MKFFATAALLLFCVCIGTAQTPAPAAPAAAPQATVPGRYITHGPVLEYVSDHDAVIAWTSSQGSEMQLHYGTSPTSLTQASEAKENSKGTNHRVKLNNLQPSTTYYIQMQVGGQPMGSVVQFQTVAKGAAPNKANQNLGPQ
jgi:phosphodiesterase/alkaline phosphatase D-like protein